MVIVRLALAIVLAMGGLPFCGHWFVTAIMDHMHGLPPHPVALLAGLIIGALFAFWRKPNWFIHTFIHEGAHALMCVLLWVKVKKFYVSDGQGGFILPERTDPVRGLLILIAPYTLPVLLLPVLFWRWWLQPPSTTCIVVHFLIGLLLIHHLHGLWHNIRINFWGKEADLVRVGRPLSMVLISGVLLLLLGTCIRVVY